MVKMNIFNAARHEVLSISIKQPKRLFYAPHIAKRPSKRSALVFYKIMLFHVILANILEVT